MKSTDRCNLKKYFFTKNKEGVYLGTYLPPNRDAEESPT